MNNLIQFLHVYPAKWIKFCFKNLGIDRGYKNRYISGADIHKGNMGSRPGRRLEEGGKDKGLCTFFFKILKYKFPILKNQNLFV